MRIIALQGKYKTGKTTTLKMLIELVLRDDKEERLIGKFGPKGETRCWVTLNGVKIGITTRGDSVAMLRGDFYEKRYNFRDRDIVVCAIRSEGKTYDFVKEQATDGLIIISKETASPEHQNEVNQNQAEEMKTELFDWIKKLEGTV